MNIIKHPASLNFHYYYMQAKETVPIENQIIVFMNQDIFSHHGATVGGISYVWDDQYLQFLETFKVKSEKIIRFRLIDGLLIDDLYRNGFIDIDVLCTFIQVYEKNPFIVWALSDLFLNIIDFLTIVKWDLLLSLPPVEDFQAKMYLISRTVRWHVIHTPANLAEFIDQWNTVLTLEPVRDIIFRNAQPFATKFFKKLSDDLLAHRYFQPKTMAAFAIYEPVIYEAQKNYIKFILYYLKNELNTRVPFFET